MLLFTAHFLKVCHEMPTISLMAEELSSSGSIVINTDCIVLPDAAARGILHSYSSISRLPTKHVPESDMGKFSLTD